MRLILIVVAAAAALALGSCSSPTSNALRTNDGVPIYNFPLGNGHSAPSSGPC